MVDICNGMDGTTANIDLSTTWISNTIDWEYSSNLSLMSISSYVEYETGNIYCQILKSMWDLKIHILDGHKKKWSTTGYSYQKIYIEVGGCN